MTQTIFPALRSDDARKAIEFLERAFGAQRVALYDREDGSTPEVEVEVPGG